MTLMRKPVSIVLIGFYYLFSPLFNLVQIALVTHLPLSGPVSLWSVLGPGDWAVLLAFPVVGFGLLSVRRWGWAAFVAFTLFLIGYNSYAYVVNQAYDLSLVLLYNITLAAVTFVFFRKHLRAPYFNPRLRWWNTDPRYQVKLSGSLGEAESACHAEILDLSATGVFLSVCADIEVGQVQTVTIEAYGMAFPVKGRVMRKTAPDDPRPGFGLMFEGLSEDSKYELRVLMARLVKNGARERGLPEDAPTGADPVYRHLLWQLRRLGHELVGA